MEYTVAEIKQRIITIELIRDKAQIELYALRAGLRQAEKREKKHAPTASAYVPSSIQSAAPEPEVPAFLRGQPTVEPELIDGIRAVAGLPKRERRPRKDLHWPHTGHPDDRSGAVSDTPTAPPSWEQPPE